MNGTLGALGFEGSGRGGSGMDIGKLGFLNALVGSGGIPRKSGVIPGTRTTTTFGTS